MTDGSRVTFKTVLMVAALSGLSGLAAERAFAQIAGGCVEAPGYSCTLPTPPSGDGDDNDDGSGGETYQGGSTQRPSGGQQVDPEAARRAAVLRRARQLSAIGTEQYKRRNYRAAAEYYSKALRLTPKNRTLKAYRADALAFASITEGDEESALRYFKEMERYDPRNDVLKANIAHTESILAERAGDYELALQKAREALQYRTTKDLLEREQLLEQGLEFQRQQAAAEKEWERQAAVREQNKMAMARDIVTGLQTALRSPASGIEASKAPKLEFVPAPTGPFGIVANPEVELRVKPQSEKITVKTPSAQLDTMKAWAESATSSVHEIMSEQAQCGFDRGPCAIGVPFAEIQIHERPRGMESLSPKLAEAVLKTENGQQLAARETSLRAKISEADKSVEAISSKLAKATDRDKGGLQVELVKARGKQEQLKQELHGVQYELEQFSIDVETVIEHGTKPAEPKGEEAKGDTKSSVPQPAGSTTRTH